MDIFLSSFVISLMAVIVMCTEWKTGQLAIINFSSPFLVFMYLMLYFLSLAMFLFACTSFFSNGNNGCNLDVYSFIANLMIAGNLAMGVGFLVHIGTYFPISTLYAEDQKYDQLSDFAKVAWCLVPNAGFFWGSKVLLALENKATGVGFANLFTPLDPSDPISMGVVYVMFLVDILICSLIIAYVDAVKPGQYGSAKKWYFPFMVRMFMDLDETVS